MDCKKLRCQIQKTAIQLRDNYRRGDCRLLNQSPDAGTGKSSITYKMPEEDGILTEPCAEIEKPDPPPIRLFNFQYGDEVEIRSRASKAAYFKDSWLSRLRILSHGTQPIRNWHKIKKRNPYGFRFL